MSLTVIVASSAGQGVEQAITALGGKMFALEHPIFDSNWNCKRGDSSLDLTAELRGYAMEFDSPVAVIIDLQTLPNGMCGITEGALETAEFFGNYEINTFFLVNMGVPGRMDGQLWHANAEITDGNGGLQCAVRIAEYGDEIFVTETGARLERSGGDSGDRHVQQEIRDMMAYRERNWPYIFDKIKKTLEPAQAAA